MESAFIKWAKPLFQYLVLKKLKELKGTITVVHIVFVHIYPHSFNNNFEIMQPSIRTGNNEYTT